MVKPVNIHDAKTHLSRLIQRAEAGEEVIIARNGKPVAKLTRIAATLGPKRHKAGWAKGKIKIADHFDDPMPEDFLRAFYEGPIEPVD